jgi:hypothetical protein
MARNKFDLDFDGFLDMAEDLKALGGEYLHKAVDNAFKATKDFVNAEIEKAMDASPYHFDGQGYSKGESKKSLEEVEQKPVEWNGTVATAKAGVNIADAPQTIILAYGTPHLAGDKKLLNALKVKGNVRKEVDRIQAEEFNKVMEEALNG